MLVENVNVYGLENAIKVSKYPKSTDTSKCNYEVTDKVRSLGSSKMGSGHDNYLCGIIVQFDLTFTNKAWVEMERYSFASIISSTSTMHCITKFDIEKQCNEYVDPRIIAVVEELVAEYNALDDKNSDYAKDLYLRVLYNVPSGFRLTAGMTTNYRQLKTIYYQRKNHRLPEWKEFCKWIETLPMFKEIVLGEVEKSA